MRKGKPFSEEHRIRISESVKGEKNGMYGRTGDKHPRYGKGYTQEGDKNPYWKGDNVGAAGAYKRAKKQYKLGLISKSELQKYGAEYRKHRKERSRK